MNTLYAYLAGLIDGEGCVSIRRCKQGRYVYYKPMIEVGMVDKRPITLLEETFGNSAWYEIMPHGKRKLICHKWRVTGTKCTPVIQAIMPYLIVKREQVQIAQDLIKRISQRGHRYTQETRACEYRARTILFKKMRKVNHPL